MKSIKDMTPDERGCNASARTMSRVIAWKDEHPKEYAEGYRPHVDRNGVMTIKHISEFEGKIKPI